MRRHTASEYLGEAKLLEVVAHQQHQWRQALELACELLHQHCRAHGRLAAEGHVNGQAGLLVYKLHQGHRCLLEDSELGG